MSSQLRIAFSQVQTCTMTRGRTALLAVSLIVASLGAARAECEDSYLVTGGGSTALKKFVTDSVNNSTQDANYKGVSLPFYTVGSSQGVSGWQNATFDYTIIDYPLSSKDYAAAGRPIVQIPLGLGAVTAFYNIPGYEASTLRLSAPVASAIWQGLIKTWDDPALIAINPNLTKIGLPPATPISVVVRNDSAAATGAWTRWLSVAGNETWQLGINNTISKWPAGFQVVSGSSNVQYAIGNTTYSIGVLDVYTGKTAKLNDTALQTAQNVSAFLRYSKGDYNLTDPAIPPIVLPEPQADWGNFSLINLPGKATFPVITTAMIVSGSDLSQLGARGRVQKQAFAYLVGPLVQAAALNYQEFPLPAQFLANSVAGIQSIKTAGGLAFYQTVHLPSLDDTVINLN